MPNKAEFFEQAARRLCGTLDLRAGLERLLAYVREVTPTLAVCVGSSPRQTDDGPDTEAEDALVFALADSRAAVAGRQPALDARQLRYSRRHRLMDPGKFHGEHITSPDHPLVVLYQRLTPSAGALPLPWYVLRLTDGEHFVGGCCFSGDPARPYTPEHLVLLRSLEPVLCIALHNHMQYQQLLSAKESVLRENARLRSALAGTEDIPLVGGAGGLRHVMERIRLSAPTDAPVLISGETGTGKELAARLLHALSDRKSGPFVALNCGAIPSSLIDSELFGHARGAFTGATTAHKGRFERADHGTLFLDEVGELPLDAQARLLRVLQDQHVEPVGGNRSVRVDVRVIAATNRDLKAMIRQGTFREDLYYRLRVVHLFMPPLRQRPEDIPPLVRHALRQAEGVCGIHPPALAPGELERMTRYAWPGNVRELQNVLMEAVVSTPPGKPLRVALDSDGADDRRQSGDLTARAAAGEVVLSADENAARHYRAVLAACRGRIKGPGGAAEALHLAPSTLRHRLQKLGIPYGRRA